ncbi:carbonic anhydrase [Trichothermofontia sp.]
MEKAIRGLRNFKAGYFCSHQDLFEQLAEGQKPRILFIACSDSRVDPNLITQSELGELFVLRNAGNIVPPYGAANGGEGAAIEYAIHALGIEQIIVCGHTHCGAMKGLLKLHAIEEFMPLVHEWLRHTEATRRLLLENYSQRDHEELIELAVAENVLTQLENLRTYPVVRSKLHQGKLKLYGWIYQIEKGEVLSYDPNQQAFVPLHTEIPACDLPQVPSAATNSHTAYGTNWLPPEQADRIYRGSASVRESVRESVRP